MAAYLIAQIEVIDQATYDEYRKGVPATIAAHGGRFLVRGGAVEVLEGDFVPRRVVVLEFPDAGALKSWYRSPEYRPLLALRKRAARGSVYMVEGT
ncbi:MAG: DUF1330 domain-containing protein [Betaproteobacteria bacterium]|nr:DUF1330 domain-containing protein [Betaproteobacteria bacterium]